MRLLILILMMPLSSCWVMRAYKVRNMNLTDHEKLSSVEISCSANPFHYHEVENPRNYDRITTLADSLIDRTSTAAFLIIRNDSIIYEYYGMGFNRGSLLPSNSMAKSFTGTLAGIAIGEGSIRSVNDPITEYLPELADRDERFNRITVQHLLNMRTGLDFNEGKYNLCDDAVKLGFRPNLEKHILKAQISKAPGDFRYQSINTQLLGLIIQRATGKPLQQYFEEKLWKPVGAANDATWNIDSEKREQVMMSAGLNATARDFAKLGTLYLKNGKMNGTEIIHPGWIQMVASTDSMEAWGGYRNQWWNRRLRIVYDDSVQAFRKWRGKDFARVRKNEDEYRLSYRTDAFVAIGFLNQVIYVHPGKKIVIVRLGRPWPRGRSFIQDIYWLGEAI